MYVPVLSDDDLGFILAVRRSLVASIATTHETWLVKVDHWFGPNWLAFSGKILGALGVWQDELTLPPFNPHRIRFEGHFVLRCGEYVRTRAQRLHIWQTSAKNTERTLRNIASSATFVWYSGDTRRSDRGSLMVYQTLEQTRTAWYAGFSSDRTGWRKGTTRFSS